MEKLEVRLHIRCPDSDQEMFRGGEASDKTSPRESQGNGIHDEGSL